MKNRNRNAQHNFADRSDGSALSDQVRPPAVPSVPLDTSTLGGATAPVDAFGAMARHWKLLAAAAAAGLIMAWLFSALQPDRYRATLLAAVAPHGDTMTTTDVLRGLEVLEQRTVVATVAALATTPAATQPAVQSDSGYTIHASVLPNTNLVRIDVEGADASRAAAIANRLPPVLSQHTRAMFKFYSVTPVSSASQPAEPLSSGSVRTILAGLLVGLVIGAAIAIAIEKSRPSNTLVRA